MTSRNRLYRKTQKTRFKIFRIPFLGLKTRFDWRCRADNFFRSQISKTKRFTSTLQYDPQLNWNEFIWYPIARCELDRIKVKPKIKGIIIFYLDKLNN